jgi:hypothetical protein
MTSTSGGNLSIRAPDGGIWITPSRVDKGSPQPTDTRDIQGFFLVVDLVAARGEAEAALTQHRHRALGLLEIGELPQGKPTPKDCSRAGAVRTSAGVLIAFRRSYSGWSGAMPAALIAAPSIPPGKKSPTIFFHRGGATGFAAARSAIVRRFF